MTEVDFSPKEFLKKRRPEYFSDSTKNDKPILDRSSLEYHLSTLSKRSQELDFETFAQKLLERTVCPNLLPHTGPSGGGDSRVDSETYPVAESIASSWYIGEPEKSSNERWAFAFSIKERWGPKIKSDIKKIAETNRGYTRAYFVSSQFIRDKLRAEYEDNLRSQYGFDVRVFDRNWILDRVFEGKHEELAIQYLKIEVHLSPATQAGPLDYAKKQDLESIEQRIREAAGENSIGLQYVTDCINAAMITRNLEALRVEVDGKLTRAENAARKYGTNQQMIYVAYQKAWTACFWHEDYELLPMLYKLTEDIIGCSDNIYNFELLSNLWRILYASVRAGKIPVDSVPLEKHTQNLIENLKRLSTDETRPSSALQAMTFVLDIELLCSSLDKRDYILKKLLDIIPQCQSLIGYPWAAFEASMIELGEYITDSEVYDELLEKIIEISQKRNSEKQAANILIKRGFQLLNDNKSSEALVSLGRSLRMLSKDESRDDLITALLLCVNAYRNIGLLWAARGALLNATNLAFYDFHTNTQITTAQATSINYLKWIELQLGRLPYILAWHELSIGLNCEIDRQGIELINLAAKEELFECGLSLLIFKADISVLKKISYLPETLMGLGLFKPANALIYALGHTETVDISTENGNLSEDEKYVFFSEWCNKQSDINLPNPLTLLEQETVNFRSSVLGCRIELASQNTQSCIELSESLLAAIESLMATAFKYKVMAIEPRLEIHIQQREIHGKFIEYEVNEKDDILHMDILCQNFRSQPLSTDNIKHIYNQLLNVLLYIMVRIFHYDDIEGASKSLIKDEDAISRAISFTSSVVTTANILGHDYDTSISKWNDESNKQYPLTRLQRWNKKILHNIKQKSSNHDYGYNDGEVDHSKLKTVSLINTRLWGVAGWDGIAYAWSEGTTAPPMLILSFSNGDAAQEIFKQWHKKIGQNDDEDILKILLIRGISKTEPYAYRAAITMNVHGELFSDDSEYICNQARVHTMYPTSDKNLNAFLSAYKDYGYYLFTYGVSDKSQGRLAVKEDHVIKKRKLDIVDAWQVGKNHVGRVAVYENDIPIIPNDKKNIPILEWFKL